MSVLACESNLKINASGSLTSAILRLEPSKWSLEEEPGVGKWTEWSSVTVQVSSQLSVRYPIVCASAPDEHGRMIKHGAICGDLEKLWGKHVGGEWG
jgi:hypothetical protein